MATSEVDPDTVMNVLRTELEQTNWLNILLKSQIVELRQQLAQSEAKLAEANERELEPNGT